MASTVQVATEHMAVQAKVVEMPMWIFERGQEVIFTGLASPHCILFIFPREESDQL